MPVPTVVTYCGGIDFADSGVQPVHNVNIPIGIHIERYRLSSRCRRRAAVAG